MPQAPLLTPPFGAGLAALICAPEVPQPAADKSVVLELAYEEYCQLVAAGKQPDPEEFCQRFPSCGISLVRRIFFHHFVEDGAAENPGLLDLYRQYRYLKVGEKFLEYLVLRKLGSGRLGQVFLARQLKLGGRHVVIKVSEEGAAVEARILGPLSHPNIVPIFSAEEDEVTCLKLVCMPYLGSTTLRNVLDRAFATTARPTSARVILEAAAAGGQDPRPDGEEEPVAPVLEKGSYVDGIVHLGIQLADALAFIHNRGIYHRDLKPSNVLLNPQGRAMLLDFNLSWDAEANSESQLGGTPQYMAPEHLRAMAAEKGTADLKAIDGRSDLFGLAVILYELLAGKNPFDPVPGLNPKQAKESCEQMLKRQAPGPNPLRPLNPGVSRRLAGAIESCLAFDPRRRLQSAEQLAEALRRCQPAPEHLQPAENLVNALRRWPSPPQPTVGRSVLALRRFGALILAGILLLPLAAVLLWGALRPAKEGAPDSKASHLYTLEQGVEYYNRGKYDQAIEHLVNVVEADPGHEQARLALGRAYQKRGDYDLAQVNYERVKGPSSYGLAQASMGYCSARQDSQDRALRHFGKAIQAGFATPEVYNNKGYCYLKIRQLELAQENLNLAIRIKPSMPAAYHNRALLGLQLALERGGILDAALVDIENAIRHTKAPVSAYLYRDAASLYAMAARKDARLITPALDHLLEALDAGLDPATIKQEELFSALKAVRRFEDLIARPRLLRLPAEPVRLLAPQPD